MECSITNVKGGGMMKKEEELGIWSDFALEGLEELEC